jgi:hypothetical protein
MAITHQERVGKALELLKAGLGPFVERELKRVYQEKASTRARMFLGDDRLLASKPVAGWDATRSGGLTPDQTLVIPTPAPGRRPVEKLPSI